MAKVLLTWELGGGSGHFVNLRPFACGLEAAGHKVFAALRDLGKGPDLLGGKAVSFLQSPYKADVPRNVVPLARTFADLLHNVGFGDAAELAVRVDAWRGLIDSVAPDLIVFDHSPTALLGRAGRQGPPRAGGRQFLLPAGLLAVSRPAALAAAPIPRASLKRKKRPGKRQSRLAFSRAAGAGAAGAALRGGGRGRPDHPGGIRPLSRPRPVPAIAVPGCRRAENRRPGPAGAARRSSPT